MVNTADNGNALNGTGPLSAGALAFAPDGTLFVGDSKGGAIWAYPPRARGRVPEVAPFLFANIDERMAELLGVETRQLAYNGLAVHPLTREPHISLGIKAGGRIEPAVVRVSLEGTILPLNLRDRAATVHTLANLPDPDKIFRSLAGEWPVPSAEYYDEKARTPMRSMAIVDIKFHDGELFVSGVSNQEFCSVLRRVPYPFTGSSIETHLEIYHVAHGNYETRAPIRTMQFATLNGEARRLWARPSATWAMASRSAWWLIAMKARIAYSSPMSRAARSYCRYPTSTRHQFSRQRTHRIRICCSTLRPTCPPAPWASR